MNNKVLLMILDGWGNGRHDKADVISTVHPEYISAMTEKYPHAELRTDGENVGLPDGQFNTNNITYRQINNDLMISYDTTFGKDWSFKAMLGHNINQNFTKYLDVTAKNLLVADIYSYANAESVITTNDQAKSRLIGVYGEIDLGYKDIVYLSVTGRNDWPSQLAGP